MNEVLNEFKCEPCNGKTPKLNSNEIINYLSKLNNWKVNDEQEMIFKKFADQTGIKVRLIEATGISLIERLKKE